jgi:hypothetical protein
MAATTATARDLKCLLVRPPADLELVGGGGEALVQLDVREQTGLGVDVADYGGGIDGPGA